MKRILFAFLIIVLPFTQAAAQQNVSVPRKFALVIGNGAYRSSPLVNPVNDAADMKTALEGLGFTVESVVNGNRIQMQDAVSRLKTRLRGLPGSYGFLFYAGHGVQSGGENFLIPVDADIPQEAYLPDRAVSLRSMLRELEDAGNALNVVVLDACRNNPFSWSRGGSRGLSVVQDAPSSSIIVYATRAGQTAEDNGGRNGLFTGQLLKNLPLDLELKEVFNRTGLDVIRASGGKQTPAMYTEFFGHVFLSPNHRDNPVIVDPVVVPPVPGPVPPVPNPVPSNTVFGGTWNGTVAYTDGKGNYRDIYNIVLFDDSTAIITVRTQQNGGEIQQDADGYWSYDDTFFRIEGDFLNPAISRLGSIRWTSVYTLDSNNRRLALLVNPAPEVRNTVRVVLTKAR
ncbi:MAG: caspase family protein [Treponema sp.]|jgi:hypothetical protein|nr:caspase family protein [Treponema sp.]